MDSDRKENGGCQVWDKGKGELFNGYRASVLQDEKVLEM